MAPKPKLNVQSFPRPPRLERTPRHLVVKWDNHLIADTTDGYWVLETHHPPSKHASFITLNTISYTQYFFLIAL